MSCKKNIKSKSLSEKILKSFEPEESKDPEIDSDDETRAKIIGRNEFNEDDEDYKHKDTKYLISDIRKRNTKLLSEFSNKYQGKVSSRKDFEEDESSNSREESGEEEEKDENEDEKQESSEGEEESSNSGDEDLEEYRKRLKNYQIDSEPDELLVGESDEDKDETDIEDDDEEDIEDSEYVDNDSDYDSSNSGEVAEKIENENKKEVEGNFFKETKPAANIQKGLSVQNQLKVWENLLEVRIRSQKMMINANSLPSKELFKKLSEENEEFLKLAKDAQQNVSGLLGKMIELQEILLKQYPETNEFIKLKNLKRKSSNKDEEIAIKRFAIELNEHFKEFTPYRNSVLQKWYDRTKILTPSGSVKNKSRSENFDIVKKIEGVLFNKNELIKKSQTIKASYTIFGEKPPETESKNIDNDLKEENENNESPVNYPEIYDDTDFYHQQLRELIEFKTNILENPTEVTKQFAELQKLRHKMKKKVDTRASKGRKIRYVVHNKLVNFMAPNDTSTFPEESKKELYNSLFST